MLLDGQFKVDEPCSPWGVKKCIQNFG